MASYDRAKKAIDAIVDLPAFTLLAEWMVQPSAGRRRMVVRRTRVLVKIVDGLRRSGVKKRFSDHPKPIRPPRRHG